MGITESYVKNYPAVPTQAEIRKTHCNIAFPAGTRIIFLDGIIIAFSYAFDPTLIGILNRSLVMSNSKEAK
jgi:hypothetical protein